jgi:AcrR family transcriptional regulator
MNDTIVKRPYRSPLRAAQAEATRQRILDAGLALFAERGYPATSITQIAAAAGVSPETIYASVGSKRGIIDALLAQIDTEGVEDRAVALVVERGGTPEAALGVVAELSATFWARHGTLVAVLRNGLGDPEIGEAWMGRQAARRGLLHRLIARWPSGALREGIDLERAADIAWALTSDELYGLFVDLRGWSFDAFVAWEREALIRELLPASRKRRAR